MGKCDYINENGGLSPMRHVYTELWDNEIGLDECLGYDYTDDNGNFCYRVDNNDGHLEGGRDVYVIIWAYSDAAKTTNNYGVQYAVPTLIKYDVPDGVVDFGSMNPPANNEAWEAVDSALSEYLWISSQVGWTRSQVHIKWPSGMIPCSYGDMICLPYKAIYGWGHTMMHHEYAHCVMWTAYGDSWPPQGYYPDGHWSYMESDEGFATIEGWAEFMQCVVDNDPNNLQYGWENIETNDWYNKQDRGDFDGDIIEGSFASILWDIFDPANDDGLNMGFDEIWTIILNDRPGSIHDIWDSWFDRGYGHDQELWQIYYNHGVNKSGTGMEPEDPALGTSPDLPSYNFGDVPEGQTKSWAFDVTNCGTGTLTWAASDDRSWIAVTPASGSTTTEADEVTITIDTTGMGVKTHTGQVTIDAGVGGSRVGTITVTVVDVADTAPPSAVTDLTATNPTSTTLTLRWTAPGDDGSTGTATRYDVRYRTGSAITESNWNSASQCRDEPTPGHAGSTETFVVTGLSPNTTYYFALKTADEVPNQSPISNSPQGVTKDGGGETTTVSFDPLKSTASTGSTTTISLTLDSAPDGLSGYNLTVSLSDPSIAEILSVSFPAWANVHDTSTLPSGSVRMKAADLADGVKSGDTNTLLGTLTIRGDADGTCDIVVTVTKMDDDSGNSINPGTVSGTIEVTSIIPLPGQSNSPTDPDRDGAYEDLNGNGNIDFDDVVQYYTHMEWIEANEPFHYFDFNGNGRIDFDDIVELFGEV
jgi:PKD repeat protein